MAVSFKLEHQMESNLAKRPYQPPVFARAPGTAYSSQSGTATPGLDNVSGSLIYNMDELLMEEGTFHGSGQEGGNDEDDDDDEDDSDENRKKRSRSSGKPASENQKIERRY